MRALALSLAFAALAAPAWADGAAWSLYRRARQAANCGAHQKALAMIDSAIALEDAGEFRRLRGFLLRDLHYPRAAIVDLERARLSRDAMAVQRANEALLDLGVDHRSTPLELE